MTKEIEQIYEIFLRHPQIGTDTRKDLHGKIFWALKGERFDANEFIPSALEKGAVVAISDSPAYKNHPRIIVVEDTLKMLQALARHHRRQSKTKIIAITGSNGKTTTKELVFNVLSQKYKTIATQENLNNHIGVPLTLLRIRPDTEIAVVEMGTNHFGEIETLCRIAEPDFGYITSFGEAHLEFFGDLQGVIHAKTELYRYLKQNDKTVFVNFDDSIQERKTAQMKRFGFTFKNHPEAQIKLKPLKDFPFVSFQIEHQSIQTHLSGAFHLNNAGAAACIGKYFAVETEKIKNGIETYIPQNNRSQIIRKGKLTIIADAYNANPTSMKAALEQLSKQPGKKLAVLGDMLELGEKSQAKHREIIEFLKQKQIPAVLIGKNFSAAGNHAYILEKYETRDQFPVDRFLNPNEEKIILIKASRSFALEKLLEKIS